MKKTSTLIAAIAALCSMGYADYIWQGGATIDNTGWATQSNWNITGSSSWDSTKSGPQSSGSGMYDPIQISGASGTVSTQLETWNVRLTLTNDSHLTFTSAKKLQAGVAGSYYNVDSTSSLALTGSIPSNNPDASGGTTVFNIDGLLTINLSQAWATNDNKPTVNLSSTGLVDITGGNQLRLASLTASIVKNPVSGGNVTVQTAESGIYMVERILVQGGTSAKLSVASFSLDNATMTLSTDALTLDAANAGKYYVGTNAAGNYVLQYVLIPEPATATLSLLALAALAARRRRK